MDYYDLLRKQAEKIDVEPGDTSYFSKPGPGLDPRLFNNGALRPHVRNSILATALNHFRTEYYNPDAWTTVWLVGSGVSFQWAAHRDPADLDCLISVDYAKFREANQHMQGLSDKEIAADINEGFRKLLNKDEDLFLDTYELTFYVNVNPSIEALKPYAAYSITADNWVVLPEMHNAPSKPEWKQLAQADLSKTLDLVHRYSKTLEDLTNASNEAVMRNHEATLNVIIQQGAGMFDDIHSRRSEAFSPTGEGYFDFNNYRWQAGKQSGAVAALKKFHKLSKDTKARYDAITYGVELPDASILIRRAIKQRRPE
jgi:hypothetical protein